MAHAAPFGESEHEPRPLKRRLAVAPEHVVRALAELQERSVRAFAVSGAWFGRRGKRLRMAWVTNLPPLGSFVTHAARNDRGRLTLSLGDSNHAGGKRATALRAPTSPHSPQSNSRPTTRVRGGRFPFPTRFLRRCRRNGCSPTCRR